MFRWFDPKQSTVRFWGDSFDLQAIADEVMRILPIADREASKAHGQE